MPGSDTDRLLCRCLGIAESEVRAATDFAGCRTICEIKQVTSAGKGCMSCHGRIKAILHEAGQQQAKLEPHIG